MRKSVFYLLLVLSLLLVSCDNEVDQEKPGSNEISDSVSVEEDSIMYLQ